MSTEFTLCRLSRSEAEHLMMAPSVAGGWVAVHLDCREAVVEVAGNVADFLALLPSDWEDSQKRPVPRDVAERIAVALDDHAQIIGDVRAKGPGRVCSASTRASSGGGGVMETVLTSACLGDSAEPYRLAVDGDGNGVMGAISITAEGVV